VFHDRHTRTVIKGPAVPKTRSDRRATIAESGRTRPAGSASASQADAALERLSAAMAHRLAQPVQSLTNAVHLLFRDDLDVTARECLRGVIEQQLHVLSALIDELRSAAR
jgi:signal transduction histidine kinase